MVAHLHRWVEWCEFNPQSVTSTVGSMVGRVRVTRLWCHLPIVGKWIQLLWDGRRIGLSGGEVDSITWMELLPIVLASTDRLCWGYDIHKPFPVCEDVLTHFIIIIIITSSDDIQPSTLITDHSPSGLLLDIK